MSETVHVAFTVPDGKSGDLIKMLQTHDNVSVGFRADDYVSRRAALVAFVDQMELKLRKNDHKQNWREQPVEALFRLMMLEVEEFKVAHEFFPVDAARRELVDIANYALILWDRLGLLDQTRVFGEQQQQKQLNGPGNVETPSAT